MRARKSDLGTVATKFATSIDIGLPSITNSTTTLNRNHVCWIFGSTSASIGLATTGRFGPELRSPVGGSFKSWRLIL